MGIGPRNKANLFCILPSLKQIMYFALELEHLVHTHATSNENEKLYNLKVLLCMRVVFPYTACVQEDFCRNNIIYGQVSNHWVIQCLHVCFIMDTLGIYVVTLCWNILISEVSLLQYPDGGGMLISREFAVTKVYYWAIVESISFPQPTDSTVALWFKCGYSCKH